MGLLESGPSPFVVVWHLFLAFAGIVIGFHIICTIVAFALRQYIKRLEQTKAEGFSGEEG